MRTNKTRSKSVIAAGVSGALALGLLVNAPGQASTNIDPKDAAGASSGPTTRAAKKVYSGILPNGSKFLLPDASTGKAPFPTPAANAVKAIPGGKAAPAGKSDPAGKYVPQTSCDPAEKPGITAFKKAVLKMYPKSKDWGSSRECAFDGISEHLEGRAWDWHADASNKDGFAAAGNLLHWLTKDKGANAKRLGIMYIGYNHRIWAIYRVNEGWRQLNNSNPHTDHVHFSFTWRGAQKQTSFWTGKVYAEDYGPCRIYAGQPAPIRTGPNGKQCSSGSTLPAQYRGKPMLWRGSNNANVKKVQQKLKVTPANGNFGSLTQTAVMTYQRTKNLPVTGAVDARTWFALGLSTLPPATAAAKPKKKVYRTLRVGSRGAAVRRLQVKLRLRKIYRTAYFGSVTKRAVQRKQRSLKWKRTGIATPKFQKRIGL
ncbi:MAG: peptidoglycan-binding domain-containing protein [Candidatus Nanopelagicales bacterium]